MITRVENGQTYTQTFRQAQCDAFNAENRLVTVTVNGQTTTFIYDGDGNLVKKIKPDGSKTLYVAGIYEVDKTSSGTVTQTRTFYPAGGAMRVDGTRYYILKDQLNSASVVTNQSGTTVGEDRFYPFGETRFTTGNMQTDKLFTGQRDTGLGIYDYKARMYDHETGRFLSPDSIIPDETNPQNWNRFSYALNNPIRYNDPDGHCVPFCLALVDAIPFVAIAVAVTATVIAINPEARAAATQSMEYMSGKTRNAYENLRQKIEDMKNGNLNLRQKCRDNPRLCVGFVILATGIAIFAATTGGNCQDESLSCYHPSSNTSTPSLTPSATSTPPNTATATPSCPPYNHCPTQTSTSPATQTNTSTPNNTPTSTSTATSTSTSTTVPVADYNHTTVGNHPY